MANPFKKINIFQDSLVKARVGWQNLTTKEYLTYGEFGLVGGINFKNGRVDWNSIPYVNEWRYAQDRYIQLKRNDVLITKDGTIGKVALVDEVPLPATLNSGVFVVRPPKDVCDPKFLFYILSSTIFEDFISKLSAGSTISHLYQKDLGQFSVKIPVDLSEQQAITEALSNIDELINSTHKLIQKKSALNGEIKRQSLLNLDNLPEIKTEKLGNIARLYQPETISGRKFSETGFPVYGANGRIGFYEMYNHELPQIMISCRGNVGSVNISVERAWINGNAMVVNIDDNDQVDKRFLFHLLQIQDFSKIATGSGQPQIVRTPLNNFEISYPSSKLEQQEIAFKLDLLDEEISKLKEEFAKYVLLKEGMMKDLLTGKIRLV